MIEKYNTRARNISSLLCVGLDADFEKLPERFKTLPESQFEFNKYIIEQTHEYAAAYKPNPAFYEARGDQGVRELKKTMDYLRNEHPDIYTIYDGKRADIGNTNAAYATAAYDWFGCDAATVNPYLGAEAIKPFLDRADKEVIILCRTSNPGAGELQDIAVNGESLWLHVARIIAEQWNENNNCMLVVGAPYPEEMKRVRAMVGNMPFLVPGVGAQGGDAQAVVEAGLASGGLGLIINSSRGIIFAEDPARAARELRDEINRFRARA